MYHKHFTTIDSTQTYLKDNLDKLLNFDSSVLISSDTQSAGHGRGGKIWDTHLNSIALSFSLVPNPTPSLSPLEIAILIIEFLKEEYAATAFIKWPNDILGPNYFKAGGILTQYIDPKTIIAGVGLNLGNVASKAADTHYRHGVEGLLPTLSIASIDKELISKKLYEFILANRILKAEILIEKFILHCGHLNKTVLIDDDQATFQGIFKGISLFGEAIVQVEGLERKFLSSSLTILN